MKGTPSTKRVKRTHSQENAKADWKGMSRISGYGTVVPKSGEKPSSTMTNSSSLLHCTVALLNVSDLSLSLVQSIVNVADKCWSVELPQQYVHLTCVSTVKCVSINILLAFMCVIIYCESVYSLE